MALSSSVLATLAEIVGPDGVVELSHPIRLFERFRLDGTTPVWTFACGDALLDKRVWMEPGANTTHVRYRALRARGAGPLSVDTTKAEVAAAAVDAGAEVVNDISGGGFDPRIVEVAARPEANAKPRVPPSSAATQRS